MADINNISTAPSCTGGFQKLISKVTGTKSEDVNSCLNSLGVFDVRFREAVKEKIGFSGLPKTMRDALESLVEKSSLHISYQVMQECSRGCWHRESGSGNLIISPSVYKYTLNIADSAEALAAHVEAFYDAAVKALANPMLKQGVTPATVLRELVDRSQQEEGVDEPDEIRRIIGRLIKRLFAAETTSEPSAHTHDSAGDSSHWRNELSENSSAQCATIAECGSYIQRVSSITASLICADCAERGVEDMQAISRLMDWAPRVCPTVKSSSSSLNVENTGTDGTLKLVVTESPLTYTASISEREILKRCREYADIFVNAVSSPVLRTSVGALRSDIERISDHEPPQDISKSLREVIERNFNVRLIEIEREDDRYATPEYFEASRADVPRVVTTRPAVVSRIDGRVLSKGLYLVPLKDAGSNEYNQFKF